MDNKWHHALLVLAVLRFRIEGRLRMKDLLDFLKGETVIVGGLALVMILGTFGLYFTGHSVPDQIINLVAVALGFLTRSAVSSAHDRVVALRKEK